MSQKDFFGLSVAKDAISNIDSFDNTEQNATTMKTSQ
jgi:hypothetical protein